jgi:para-aminobenzoate synthetase component I
MAVAVRSGGRVLVEALVGSASPTDVLRAVRGSAAFLFEDGTGSGWTYLAPRPGAVLERHDPAGAFDAARALLERAAREPPAGGPPFWGGIAGSFGYDLARGLEELPSIARDDLGLPCLRLHLVDELLAFDHRRGLVLAVAPSSAGIRRLASLYARARHVAPVSVGGGTLDAISYDAYRPLAERVLEHIGRGDVYQANLTHRLSGACGSALELYAALREGAPVPYNLFLGGERFQLAGASPETFLRMQPGGGTIESRPIKGTAPRSDDPVRDRELAAALAVSPKDRAENTMIVDLARNDLSRVCSPGSVRVTELCAVEAHPTVHQMVSTIEGRLRPGIDALAAIAAAFPPGSMTGCPKVRAMRVIEQLEPVRRGPYAGAFGWMAPDGACDLAVVIRTAVVTAGRAYLHVGGAIVADSEARAEYEESLLKARTVARALGVPEVPTSEALTA